VYCIVLGNINIINGCKRGVRRNNISDHTKPLRQVHTLVPINPLLNALMGPFQWRAFIAESNTMPPLLTLCQYNSPSCPCVRPQNALDLGPRRRVGVYLVHQLPAFFDHFLLDGGGLVGLQRLLVGLEGVLHQPDETRAPPRIPRHAVVAYRGVSPGRLPSFASSLSVSERYLWTRISFTGGWSRRVSSGCTV